MAESLEHKFKVVSVQPEVIIINQNTDSEEIDISPIVPSPVRKIIDKIDLPKVVEEFYQEVSTALANKDLTWEAELEVGLEYFGASLKAKIKVAPK
jgi:hypothetical protein